MKRLYSLLVVLSLTSIFGVSSLANGYENKRLTAYLSTTPESVSILHSQEKKEVSQVMKKDEDFSGLTATLYEWMYRKVRPQVPYKGTLQLDNLGNKPITILYASGSDSNFICDLGQFINMKIYPGESKTFNASFNPLSRGEHSLIISFFTDFGDTVYSYLHGFGTNGLLKTTDINFDTTIVSINKPNSRQLKIECVNSAFTSDSVIISDLVVISGTINPELTVFSQDGFRYDKQIIGFPKVLHPGEMIIVNCEFLAHSSGVHAASLRTVSDAETEVTSHWVGYGINKLSVPINSEDNKFINNLSINPNPSGENRSVVSFTLGVKANTELTIFDNSGAKVGFLSLGTIDAGSYTVKAPIEGLSSGTYMLRLSSGPYKQEQQIVIVK